MQPNNFFNVAFWNEMETHCYIIYHLTSILLPHYLAKFECLTVQLYGKVVQFKSMQNRFFTVNMYQKYRVFDQLSMEINFQYYSMCTKCSPSAHTLSRAHRTIRNTCQFIIQKRNYRLMCGLFWLTLVNSWTFKFRKVVWQHIWGKVTDCVPVYFAVRLRMHDY